MNRIVPVIERLETGTPPSEIRQSDAAEFVAGISSLKRNRHRIHKLYANTLIDTRYMAIDLTADEGVAFHTERPEIQNRMDIYMEHAVPLSEQVARKALKVISPDCKDNNQLEQKLIDAIGLVVVVSSTGFFAPGLDTELIKRLGLKRNIARATVGFMGCAAAMNGLRIACDHVRAYPKNKALLVCVELSSVNAVFEDEINDVIIHSIFADGCAAVVVGACNEVEAARQGYVVIDEHMSYLAEDTEDGIVLKVQDQGITCKLSKQLPDYIRENVGKCVEGFLQSHGLSKDEIDLWAVHPGGVKIIKNVQSSLGLRDDQVANSWEILRKYGNMLSPAVLFVMERMLQRIRLEEDNQSQAKNGNGNGNGNLNKKLLRGIAFSFAPGVGLEGILFRKFLPSEISSWQAFQSWRKTGEPNLQLLSS